MELGTFVTQKSHCRMVSQQVCDVCHGTGKEIKEKCPTCAGSVINERHEVKVTVPAGVEDGQQCVFKDKEKLVLIKADGYLFIISEYLQVKSSNEMERKFI